MDWPTVVAALGIGAGCCGAFLAYRTYVLKSGAQFRGRYTYTSSVYSEDDHVSIVVVENVKDRAVTVYGIYLRIGSNLYLTIEDFGDAPLLLGAFETFQRDYNPVDCHVAGIKRVRLGGLLKDPETHKRLVLSTGTPRV